MMNKTTGCEFPKIQTFDRAPSAAEFESGVELTNFPAVFRGCASSDWDAISKWNPFNNGLDYLKERAGSVEVEAMLSRTAPIFNGDIRSHERVSMPFSDFIRLCKQHMISKEENGSVGVDDDANSASLCSIIPQDPPTPGQIYLAQFPILNDEKEDKVQLKSLRQDIQTPSLLGGKSLSSINFWMNSAQARSSTHYDPYHNLLCLVSGCKKVVLWPPSASPSLYPMPIYGEASNHSSVGLDNPNFSDYPRAEHSLKQSQEVTLKAGDAVFIPEGWFHQVDSDELTIAVNFWWQSNIMSNMPEHMDSYYLRRITRRLIDREMSLLVSKPSSSDSKPSSTDLKQPSEHIDQDGISQSIEKGTGTLREKTPLDDLDPSASQALHDLISLVHDHVNAVGTSRELQHAYPSYSDPAPERNNSKILVNALSCLEDDRVAHMLWNLEASKLRDVLLAMARYFPRTLEALILHMLSPVAAEVLTQKFDEIDQQSGEEDRSQFYREFYGAFDDDSAAMDIILTKKEAFAFQAFENVLDKYLGVNIASPTTSI